MIKKTLVLGLIIALYSCQDSATTQSGEIVQQNDTTKKSVPISAQQEKELHFASAINFAQFCDSVLREGNAKMLKPFVNDGVLFSPYASVDTANARFEKLEDLISPSNQLHFWGIYQGRGDSILLSTPDYFKKFVFTFHQKKDSVDVLTYSGKSPKKRGSEQQNLPKIYPHSTFVEFYHLPSKEGYMDWSSLIYVVKKGNKQFHLKAIVHNQWTP